MIKLTNKATAPVPSILQTKGKIATEALVKRYENGEKEFTGKDFDSSIYGHKDVKDALINLQGGKCCFCESKITHISYGDVEHFRPKAGWVQDEEELIKPGYYWLAYDWNNLLLSCQLCNQRHKKNQFPLLHSFSRALSHHDNLLSEEPVFIHPANDEPENFITFKENIPVSIDRNLRGKNTIARLGLDREPLNEQRLSRLNMVRDIYDLAKGYPETDQKQNAKWVILKYLDSSQLDSTEYASMLRSFFRDNPIDF